MSRSQMITMQCLFYLSLAVTLEVLVGASTRPRDPGSPAQNTKAPGFSISSPRADAEPHSPRRFGEAHRSKLLRFVVDHDVDSRGMVRARPRSHGNDRETRVPPCFRERLFSAIGYRRRLDESAREKATPSEKAHASSLFRPHVRRFISAFACAAVLDACFLCVVVGRAKKCLDFAATAYLVHFASCCAVAGVPKGAGWWVTTGAGVAITAVLGEYLCVSREMRDIPLAGGGGDARNFQRGTTL